MPSPRRVFWTHLVTAAVPVSLGVYRIAMLAMRKELSLEAILGEVLAMMIMAVLTNWAAQLWLDGNQAKRWLTAWAVSMVTLAVGGLLYLPKETSFYQIVTLVGLCQLLITAFVIAAWKPKLAAARALRNRR